MNILEEAIIYATEKHSGQLRRGLDTLYILHPLEVANIISTLTSDLEVQAAGVLHDTIEDCHVSEEELKEKFGERVLNLVKRETEDRSMNGTDSETWQYRKEKSLEELKNEKDLNVKIMWLSDKLSNMRAFYRRYVKTGYEFVNDLHEKNLKKQGWYYRTILENLSEFKDTLSYKEYEYYVKEIFG